MIVFASNNIDVGEMMEFVFKKDENIVALSENAEKILVIGAL